MVGPPFAGDDRCGDIGVFAALPAFAADAAAARCSVARRPCRTMTPCNALIHRSRTSFDGPSKSNTKFADTTDSARSCAIARDAPCLNT